MWAEYRGVASSQRAQPGDSLLRRRAGRLGGLRLLGLGVHVRAGPVVPRRRGPDRLHRGLGALHRAEGAGPGLEAGCVRDRARARRARRGWTGERGPGLARGVLLRGRARQRGSQLRAEGLGDRVPEDSDAVDLELDDVSRAKPATVAVLEDATAADGAGAENVAGKKARVRRRLGDELVPAPVHEARVPT